MPACGAHEQRQSRAEQHHQFVLHCASWPGPGRHGRSGRSREFDKYRLARSGSGSTDSHATRTDTEQISLQQNQKF